MRFGCDFVVRTFGAIRRGALLPQRQDGAGADLGFGFGFVEARLGVKLLAF